jgi:tyrosyl-tRNA synthetase
MTEATFLSVFEGVPSFDVKKELLSAGISFSSLCTEHTRVFPSKGDLRRLVEGGGVSLNKTRVEDPETMIKQENLINGKYLLVQKGKKNYFLIRAI